MRWLLVLSIASCASPPPPAPPPAPPKVIAIAFKVESSNLTTGDEIEITSLHGDRPTCTAGGTYAIGGRYLLGSRGDAELVVSAPNHTSHAEKGVIRGPGEFNFTLEFANEGPFEVAFQKSGGGSSAGGIVVACSEGPGSPSEPGGSAVP